MSDTWNSTPSLTLSIIALVLFSISTLWHVRLFKQCRQNCLFFKPFVLGAIFQVIGFITRTISIKNLTNSTAYQVQATFILLAPIFYMIAITRLLPAIIQYIYPESIVTSKPSKTKKLFMAIGALAFLLQIVGENVNYHAGYILVMIGLAVQLACFVGFIFLTIAFDRKTLNKQQSHNQGDWRRLLRALEFSSVLLIIRMIYRLVEYAGGDDSSLTDNEAYFYVFDSLMMLLTQGVYNVVHPGAILIPYNGQVLKNTEEKVAIKVQG